MATVAIHAPELSGETGLTLYLYTEAGVLTNTGGDALSESPASSGRFTASVAETISAIHHARVHDAVGVVRDGWLPAGGALVQDSYPSEALSDAQSDQLDAIYEKTALITGARLSAVGPVTAAGDIELIAGKDYTEDAANSLSRTVSDAGGVLYAVLTDETLSASKSFGAARPGQEAGTISGTIASVSYASNVTTIVIEVPASELPDTLEEADDYLYQIHRVTSGGKKVVVVQGNLTVSRKTV